jgi:hypothetical protein
VRADFFLVDKLVDKKDERKVDVCPTILQTPVELVARASWSSIRLQTGGDRQKVQRSAQRLAAVWVAVLDCASHHEDRGSVSEMDLEEIAVSFDYEVEHVSKILAVFEEKGMITSGRIAAWERRQVHREHESDSRARGRACQRLKEQAPDGKTEVTPPSRHVTPGGHEETEAVSEAVSASISSVAGNGKSSSVRESQGL